MYFVIDAGPGWEILAGPFVSMHEALTLRDKMRKEKLEEPKTIVVVRVFGD